GLVIGLIAFLFPGPTLLSLVGFFALYLIIDGGFPFARAGRGGQPGKAWGFLTFEGMFGIWAGILSRPTRALAGAVFLSACSRPGRSFPVSSSCARPFNLQQIMAGGGWRSAGSFRWSSE